MTEKLYYNADAGLHFSARVLACEAAGEGWRVLLDRSGFYPEGGGQPADHGLLGGVRVFDVQNAEGELWHFCAAPLPVGLAVEGAPDAARRLRYTQQHTAQHVLSAVLRQKFGAQTLSVHFGEEQTTLDADLALDEAALTEAAAEANALLSADIPVRCFFPAPAELDLARLRKAPPASSEPLRIVEIGALDYTACCGTHCASTARAGALVLLRAESYKGGVRLAFVCGEQARERLIALWSASRALQQRLAVAETQVVGRVEKLIAENAALKKECRALLDERLAREAEALAAEAEPIGGLRLLCRRMDSLDPASRRALLNLLCERPGLISLIGGSDGESAALLFGCDKARTALDLRPIFQASLALLEGKGGGSRFFCQGQGKRAERLDEALALAKEAVRRTQAADAL